MNSRDLIWGPIAVASILGVSIYLAAERIGEAIEKAASDTVEAAEKNSAPSEVQVRIVDGVRIFD